MIHTEYPGGWYVDALPTGERCVLFKGIGVDTHRGRIPLPLGESFGVIFLTLADSGIFRFAGQAHDTLNPAGYEWVEGSGWRSFPPPCCGTNPLIYDATGALQRSDCSIGSQGYRYVDDAGRLVTGDQSMAFTTPTGDRVHEFTRIADVLIGQGHEGGVVVWAGDALRLLHPGACFNIRMRHVGDAVAVSFYSVAADGLSAHIYQTTRAELRALPAVAATPIPAPAPAPVPPPKPEPPMSDVLATVKAIRAKFPPRNLTPAQLGALLNEVAWIHRHDGVGLEAKGGGFTAVQPRTGVTIASDILRFPGNIGRDVLGDGDGVAEPVWGDPGPATAKFVDPVEPLDAVSTSPAPTPTPNPSVPPSPGAALDAEIRALREDLAAVRARLAAVEARPVPVPSTPSSAPSLNGLRVAFKTASGKYICEDRDKRAVDGTPALLANRASAGEWETFTLELK